jgi:hypothetical protein
MVKQQERARLEEVNDQVAKARTKVQDLWAKFEKAREPLAQAGAELNPTAIKKAEKAHEEYEASAEELRTFESAREIVFGEIAAGQTTTTASGPLALGQPGCWLGSAISQVKAANPGLDLAVIGGGGR